MPSPTRQVFANVNSVSSITFALSCVTISLNCCDFQRNCRKIEWFSVTVEKVRGSASDFSSVSVEVSSKIGEKRVFLHGFRWGGVSRVLPAGGGAAILYRMRDQALRERTAVEPRRSWLCPKCLAAALHFWCTIAIQYVVYPFLLCPSQHVEALAIRMMACLI